MFNPIPYQRPLDHEVERVANALVQHLAELNSRDRQKNRGENSEQTATEK